MHINRQIFFDQIKQTGLFNKLTQDQVDGIEAILDEWEKSGRTDNRQLGYMLGTTYHETDKTMQPIEEYKKGKYQVYGKRIKMNRKPYTDTKSIFYGRGFVQLTWYENYDKAGKKLGQDFLNHPEKVMDLDNATKIMFMGMEEGWFTGKKLSKYFNATTEDWKNARRIINGLDRATEIAEYSKKFYSALEASI